MEVTCGGPAHVIRGVSLFRRRRRRELRSERGPQLSEEPEARALAPGSSPRREQVPGGQVDPRPGQGACGRDPLRFVSRIDAPHLSPDSPLSKPAGKCPLGGEGWRPSWRGGRGAEQGGPPHPSRSGSQLPLRRRVRQPLGKLPGRPVRASGLPPADPPRPRPQARGRALLPALPPPPTPARPRGLASVRLGQRGGERFKSEWLPGFPSLSQPLSLTPCSVQAASQGKHGPIHLRLAVQVPALGLSLPRGFSLMSPLAGAPPCPALQPGRRLRGWRGTAARPSHATGLGRSSRPSPSPQGPFPPAPLPPRPGAPEPQPRGHLRGPAPRPRVHSSPACPQPAGASPPLPLPLPQGHLQAPDPLAPSFSPSSQRGRLSPDPRPPR